MCTRDKQLVAALLLSLFSGWALAQQTYQLTDLGTLGGIHSSPRAINDSGQVTGGSHTGVEFHAFLWDSTTMKDLGTLGGNSSEGLAINRLGKVTGYANIITGQYPHAFLWNGTTMLDLGTLGGTQSEASGINASGQVT